MLKSRSLNWRCSFISAIAISAWAIFNKMEQGTPIIFQVSAADLREVVKNLYAEEQERTRAAIEQHREKPTLTRNETAKLLGVTLSTLWGWAKSGYLVPVKIGTKVMYRPTDVEALLNRKNTKEGE